MAYKIKRPVPPYYIPLSDKIEKSLDAEWKNSKSGEDIAVGDKVKLRDDVLARHSRSMPAHMGYSSAQFAWRDTLDRLKGKTGEISRVFQNSNHVNVTFGEEVIGIDATELVKVGSKGWREKPGASGKAPRHQVAANRNKTRGISRNPMVKVKKSHRKLTEKERDRMIDLHASAPLTYRPDPDDKLMKLGLVQWYDDAKDAVENTGKPFYGDNGRILPEWYDFKAQDSIKEFPGLRQFIRNYLDSEWGAANVSPNEVMESMGWEPFKIDRNKFMDFGSDTISDRADGLVVEIIEESKKYIEHIRDGDIMAVLPGYLTGEPARKGNEAMSERLGDMISDASANWIAEGFNKSKVTGGKGKW